MRRLLLLVAALTWLAGCEAPGARPYLANEKRLLWQEYEYKQAARKESEGDLMGAVEILQRIQATEPSKAEPYLDLVRILLELKWYPQAQEVLDLAALNNVDDPRLLPYQGMLLVRTDKPAEALKVLEEAESARFISTRYTVAIAAAEMLEDRAAVRRWAELGLKHAPDAVVTSLLAGLEWLDRKHDEALSLYDSALKLEPGNPEVLEAAALCALEADDVDRALKYLHPLAIKTDLRPSLLAAKGRAHAQLGEREAALKDLFAAADLGMVEVWRDLGELYLESNELEKARKAFTNHLRHYPDDVVSHYGQARALMGLLQPREAVASLEQAPPLRDSYLLSCALGDACWQSGDPDAAREAYDRACRLKPEAEYPRAALERLASP